MATAVITWKLPAVGKNQRALMHAVVDLAAEGAPFVELATVPASAEQVVRVPEIESGSWQVRLTAFDTAGAFGPSALKTFSVPFAAPGLVTDVQVVFE